MLNFFRQSSWRLAFCLFFRLTWIFLANSGMLGSFVCTSNTVTDKCELSLTFRLNFWQFLIFNELKYCVILSVVALSLWERVPGHYFALGRCSVYFRRFNINVAQSEHWENDWLVIFGHLFLQVLKRGNAFNNFHYINYYNFLCVLMYLPKSFLNFCFILYLLQFFPLLC